jgi:polysaccharide deacetylase 2 family uncharacterized protein YibQ
VTDDLSAPLGQQPEKRRFSLPAALPRMIASAATWTVAGALGAFLAVFLMWAALVDDPYGGEPIVVASADARAAVPAARRDEQPPTAPLKDAPLAPKPDDAAAPAKTEPAHTVTIIDGSSGKREEVPVGPGAGPGTPPVATAPTPVKTAALIDTRLLETTRHGQIPQISSDGARPADVYSRAVIKAKGGPEAPKIAIIVNGLGVSSNGTAQALSKLPAAVTLGFAPYSTDLERLITRARGEGHEVLLQVPMEPFDYPDNDPGPQTLLTSLAPDQNIDRLHWLMSRFKGYVGISNYMGARFTATDPALAPILREVAKRGLVYVDDGSSPRSLAGQIAGANNMSFAKADVVLDAVPMPNEIDRALTRLETIAAERGFAVGVASALPSSVERIAGWVKAVETRGFSLVPVTGVASKPKTSGDGKT